MRNVDAPFGSTVRFIPEIGKRVVHILVSLIASVLCFFLAHASIKFLLFEKESGGVLFGNFPLWISELIIPSTFCFLTYQFFIHAFEAPAIRERDEI